MTTPELLQLSQKERILKLLQERGSEGVMVYEIMAPRPSGLGVAQYNTRIKELREKGHNIVNQSPGHFVLNDGKTHQFNALEKPQPLEGETQSTWTAMGAYLRGEGPKPETRQQFMEVVQEALI